MSTTIAANLVDRDGELDALTEVLAATIAGRGATVLVEGAAGIGKTSLLAATRALAGARGMTVLHARGTDLERDFAFGVVRQCLEPLVRREPDAARLLRGAAALAAPVLRDVAGPTTGPPAGLLHGLYWLVANAAEDAPVVLTIDDGHWADEPSLRFLTYLARRAEAMPVAVVVAARPVGGSDEPTATVLSELGADPDTRRIGPLALSAAGIERPRRARARGRGLGRGGARRCRDPRRHRRRPLPPSHHERRGARGIVAARTRGRTPARRRAAASTRRSPRAPRVAAPARRTAR